MKLADAYRVVRDTDVGLLQGMKTEMLEELAGLQDERVRLKAELEEVKAELDGFGERLRARREQQGRVFEKLAKECEEKKREYEAERLADADRVVKECQKRVKDQRAVIELELAVAYADSGVMMDRLDMEIGEKKAILSEVEGKLDEIRRRL